MTDIWVVVIEDRHSDVDVLPFSSASQAIRVARGVAEAVARHPESVNGDAEMTAGMVSAGWVFLATYSTEGDCVRVVKRTLDDAS